MSTLLCHPLNSAPMVRAIEATVSRTTDGDLEFIYRLSGDMARILVPAPDQARRQESLWEHTCFEAFISVPGSTAYLEFNFSPSGEWASYAFSGYRQPEATTPALPVPMISAQRTEGHLELVARLSCSKLPLPYTTSALEIGLTAVIENTDTVDGNHSYWALCHPSHRPDFHQRASFTFELPLP